MAFWSQSGAPEPNRQFRWYINLAGANGLATMRYALKKAAKPTMKIGEVKHKYLNHEFFYPGRVEWEPITISFASVKTEILKTADNVLMNILVNSGYTFPTAPDNAISTAKITSTDLVATNMTTISKIKAVNQIAPGGIGNSLQLIQINANGQDIETWYLFNPFFTDVKFDTLEYATDEILNLDCTIKYDYASLDDINGKKL
jgi:hypothetical protein